MNEPHIPQPRPIRKSDGGWPIAALAVFATVAFFVFVKYAHAADTLVPVSPPTDWIGILIVCAFGLIVAALVGYIVYIKRTPGAQLGEEQLERLAELVSARNSLIAQLREPPAPIVYDGITFLDEEHIEKYKAAKAIVDFYKKGTTP